MYINHLTVNMSLAELMVIRNALETHFNVLTTMLEEPDEVFELIPPADEMKEIENERDKTEKLLETLVDTSR